mgnify:CR=1 FL=1
MSAGETPEILLAWPNVSGRTAESFWRASNERPRNSLKFIFLSILRFSFFSSFSISFRCLFIYPSYFISVSISSTTSKKEFVEFVEGLTNSQFEKIQKFFESTPRLEHTFTVKNPNTEVENEIVLEGLASFFAWVWLILTLSHTFVSILPWCNTINIAWQS